MKQIEVVAAIIRKGAKIFATQRGYGDWKDWWEFPGGKMEVGETPEEALKREIREELSTEIGVYEFLCTVEYDYPEFHLTMHCYICSLLTKALHLNEHEAARWLTKDELDSVKWLPADLLVIDEMKRKARHRNMAAVRSKDTKPEMIVRRGLWSRGFRYRLNHKRLPGHPDLVLRKYRTCIFVNGCFWHGHLVDLRFSDLQSTIENSACCKIPKTNREFWVAKIRRNKERDREEQKRLAAMGWHCITVWECELKPAKREETLESLAFTLNRIWLQDHAEHGRKNYPPMEEESGDYLKAAED